MGNDCCISSENRKVAKITSSMMLDDSFEHVERLMKRKRLHKLDDYQFTKHMEMT